MGKNKKTVKVANFIDKNFTRLTGKCNRYISNKICGAKKRTTQLYELFYKRSDRPLEASAMDGRSSATLSASGHVLATAATRTFRKLLLPSLVFV